MPYTTLISNTDLAAHLGDAHWVIVDCRFTFTEPDRGRGEYLEAHIPGAVYAHLEQDLSGQILPGKTGRHPLPSLEAVVETFSNWGISDGVQVVAYDDWAGGSAAVAPRLWWMLRWLGHSQVAVLDGGWVLWKREKRPSQSGAETRLRREFIPVPRPELIVAGEDVERLRLDPNYMLLDSRSPDRFRGENETFDPVAGHIPCAVNAPYMDNLGSDGRFLPRDSIQARFHQIFGNIPAERAVFYCGSGVTAAANLLALAHAGMGEGRLYVGSWSEWITDPGRPVATGNE